ncbi:hypothetical protein TW73_21440 [Pseudoalteromonas piscicida]|nr:hypothetical protein TW73_21440 [Pseudoalteromonas piscicida]
METYMILARLFYVFAIVFFVFAMFRYRFFIRKIVRTCILAALWLIITTATLLVLNFLLSLIVIVLSFVLYYVIHGLLPFDDYGYTFLVSWPAKYFEIDTAKLVIDYYSYSFIFFVVTLIMFMIMNVETASTSIDLAKLAKKTKPYQRKLLRSISKRGRW